jgi:hypothetical protein
LPGNSEDEGWPCKNWFDYSTGRKQKNLAGWQDFFYKAVSVMPLDWQAGV